MLYLSNKKRTLRQEGSQEPLPAGCEVGREGCRYRASKRKRLLWISGVWHYWGACHTAALSRRQGHCFPLTSSIHRVPLVVDNTVPSSISVDGSCSQRAAYVLGETVELYWKSECQQEKASTTLSKTFQSLKSPYSRLASAELC